LKLYSTSGVLAAASACVKVKVSRENKTKTDLVKNAKELGKLIDVPD
jgi:hypothetical protein